MWKSREESEERMREKKVDEKEIVGWGWKKAGRNRDAGRKREKGKRWEDVSKKRCFLSDLIELPSHSGLNCGGRGIKILCVFTLPFLLQEIFNLKEKNPFFP